MDPDHLSHYNYTPSTALAGVAAGLFFVGFAATLYQTCRTRAWVWLVFAFAAAMEAIGYVVRVVSSNNVTEKPPYVIQFVLIVLAPVIMAGVIYVIFSRIVFWVVAPESRTLSFLWVPPRFLTLIFVGIDIAALLLQLVAAIIISGTSPTDSNADSRLNTGKDIGIAGVTIQIVGFGFFSIIAVRFHFTSRNISPDFERSNKLATGVVKDWRRLLQVVNASCLLILVRSVYREIEFVEGKTGQVQQAEWYPYVFDALPILLVVIIFNIWFPGRYLAYLNFRLPKEYLTPPTSMESMDLPRIA